MIRTLIDLARARDGVAAVEFALISIPLCLLAIGTAQFGLALSQYVMLVESVSTGARQLSVSRGIPATPSPGPRQRVVNLMQSAAPNLVSGSITITTRVNGTVCADDPACATALTSAAGLPATVTATYPCDLNVFGYNFAPGGCTLSSTTVERIE